jgi:exosortase
VSSIKAPIGYSSDDAAGIAGPDIVPIARAGVLAALFIGLFWPNLWRLWGKTNPLSGEPEWRHAMFIPLIGLLYLYANREQLAAARVRPGWLGGLIMLGGISLFGYGIWPGQNDFIKDFGMVVTLFGMVALTAGWEVMKIAWFPIVFLVCGIPWPGLVYSWVAGPLQRIAAQVAVVVLNATGVDAESSGTKIIMPMANNGAGRALNVAEACSGLKALMTFITLGAAIAFLSSSRPMWQKIFIVVSAVPIAIFCNVMRVSGQGLLDHYVSTQLSEGFAHGFVGLVMMIPAFIMLFAVGWILDRLFIDQLEEEDVAKKKIIIRRAATQGEPV